jgi:deoxyribodipyrimidine photo-lyase
MSFSTIVWFRQDLRLQDNPALKYALDNGNIIPIYILDITSAQEESGNASKWWLHHSLQSLSDSFSTFGHKLHIFVGNPLHILQDLLKQTGANSIVWNRCYEPYAIERDSKIKEYFQGLKVSVKSFNSNLLFEPWTIFNKQGSFFKVFTPFWKHCLMQTPEVVVDSIAVLQSSKTISPSINSLELNDLNLLPKKPDWSGGLKESWKPGEPEALNKLKTFLQNHIDNYKHDRDFMDQVGTSRLSPHLHFGEISPRYIWTACKELLTFQNENIESIHSFLSEIGWREFSYHLLYHVPTLTDQPIQPKFNAFPWKDDEILLNKWQKGKTGIPIVDAAMRELWHTGYMHNRARMIVASFLTKNLLIPWQNGAKWFLDTLVDADLASNSVSWQWVAGCGVDAAPYFRIFNPVSQGEKFDPKGDYVKKWIPELSSLDIPYIHQPWKAPLDVLEKKYIILGKTYPKPIIDLKESRNLALSAYKHIQNATL